MSSGWSLLMMFMSDLKLLVQTTACVSARSRGRFNVNHLLSFLTLEPQEAAAQSPSANSTHVCLLLGGRNGYGAKLCNIFSTKFTVETACKEYRHSFKQVTAENVTVFDCNTIVNTTACLNFSFSYLLAALRWLREVHVRPSLVFDMLTALTCGQTILTAGIRCTW